MAKPRHQTRRRKQNQRLQNGGYYYAVFDGIRAAGMLMPLVARQGWRLLSSKNETRRRSQGGGQSKGKGKGKGRKTRNHQ